MNDKIQRESHGTQRDSQDLAHDKTRREFISDSAKLAGITALASAFPLMAKDSNKNSQNKRDTMNSQQIWYITGASGGLGFALENTC